MIKKLKHSTKPKKPTNPVELTGQPKWLEDYRDYRTWSMSPLTDHLLEQICKDYIQFAQNPKVLKPKEFFIARGLNPDFVYLWPERYPHFKEAHEFVKTLIGNRREVGALTRELDSSFVEKMMPKYDLDWKDMVEWRNKLKVEAESGNKANVIVLSEFDYSKMEKK